MHHSGPLLLTFEDPNQGFGGKNCQNGSQGKPWSLLAAHVISYILLDVPPVLDTIEA